ncbi:metallophosphoesterase [Schinkia azotoformans]|uniref:metallophosphoesterase n=1 Tax=Schinkia azotoformans TaxID=1454 RepID=UPI002E21E417|nr:metallophosphoesterase [Schinkia azotoformans]MED4351504.1 metallophosphoesterase [Schinkia azotoformans]
MKIAILSDIHEGLNRKKTRIDIMTLLNNWLDANQPDVFIISGDMTAGPEKSLNLLNQLQNSNPQIKIIFVHGNHDVYYGDSTQAYEILLKFPGNLGNGPIKSSFFLPKN